MEVIDNRALLVRTKYPDRIIAAIEKEKDKFVWDVSHQVYVHKLLTGRKDRFHTIRTTEGLNGFAFRTESEHDCYGAGHAGTALSAALGMSCGDCHQGKDNNWDGFAVDNARKRKTRDMIAMMKKINDDNFAGRQLVTCYSCHRSADAPRNIPNFAELYGFVPPDPNAIVTQSPAAPKPDEVFDKYLAAVGGAQKAAALTSRVRLTRTRPRPRASARSPRLVSRAMLVVMVRV